MLSILIIIIFIHNFKKTNNVLIKTLGNGFSNVRFVKQNVFIFIGIQAFSFKEIQRLLLLTFIYQIFLTKVSFFWQPSFFPSYLSWRRPLSYRSQSIHLQNKSIYWLPYYRELHHERIKHQTEMQMNTLRDKLNSWSADISCKKKKKNEENKNWIWYDELNLTKRRIIIPFLHKCFSLTVQYCRWGGISKAPTLRFF